MADDVNISPEMINNLVSMLKNSGVNNNATNTNTNANSGTNYNNSETNSSDNTNSSSINMEEIFSHFSNQSASKVNSNPSKSAPGSNPSNSEFGSNFSNDSNSNSDENNNSSLDFETIMKMKSIIETLNDKNDAKSNLLYSLKPYLRKSKQYKLEQYANLLKITQVSNLFRNEKGGSK